MNKGKQIWPKNDFSYLMTIRTMIIHFTTHTCIIFLKLLAKLLDLEYKQAQMDF